MSNKKSSIEAQLKLSGLAAFRSGLGQIGTDARKVGEAMRSAIPAPDITKTQVYRDNEYRKQNAANLTRYLGEQEKKRADIAIKEQNRIALESRRIQMSGGRSGYGHLSGTMYQGGKMDVSQVGKSGRSRAYGLGVGYNAIQDAVQGGPAAVANNVPQILELLGESPKLMAAAKLGAIALAGYAANKLFQSGWDNTFGFDESIAKRNIQNRKAMDMNAAPYRASGEAVGARDNENLRVSGLSGGAESRRLTSKEREIELVNQGKLARIEAIEDPAERAKKAAEEEARIVEEAHQRNLQRTKDEWNLAAAEQAAAEERKNALVDEIKLINEKATTFKQADFDRRAFLEGQLPAASESLNAARGRSETAIANMGNATGAGGAIAAQKENIQAGLKAQLEVINKQRELIEAEGRMNQHNEQVDFKRMAAQARLNLKEQEKERQTIRDELSNDEALANMSPRKRAKAEEAQRLAANIKELNAQGIHGKEAEDMAGRRMKLSNDADPSKKKRIRGAGYGGGGGSDFGGLGSATYGGLDDLAAMQPAASRERKTIKGAGAKEKKSGSNDNPDNLYQVMVKGFAEVVKAVRDTGPNATDRAKPSSSN